MLERCLSAIVLVGYAASQLATLPHAHASPPLGHGCRPHLHCGWLIELVDEAHSHHHGNHSHDAGQRGHEHPHPQENPQPGPDPDLPSVPGHDEDSIYVSDAAQPGKVGAYTDLIAQFGNIGTTAIVLTASPGAVPLLDWIRGNTPSHLVCGCALY